MKKITYLILFIISIAIMISMSFIPALQTVTTNGGSYLGIPAFWLVIYADGSFGFQWAGFLLNILVIYVIVLIVAKVYQLFYRFITTS
ncbi:hypothetical protein [Oceanobacillus iheyensis HTE831]|uniref:Uncharacterized protein n=1 Tax=Oceanobacillus iheyensis (strain DSM 14371 / CIP 107618 / JCM 11309 / KCTC 3954 / HTE831) TaxID=221109 RepID=Q8EKZ7_OCEIH|nr:hypothetical protein [Oceanobacillus iheyensis]BAC15391.1 hypothetical protein [Oceanobacillus iheyensis HTE831]